MAINDNYDYDTLDEYLNSTKASSEKIDNLEEIESDVLFQK